MPTDIVFPTTVRPALAAIQFAPVDVARSVPMDQGEKRRRALYTKVPQVATVQWLIFQTSFDAFWDWYEDDLNAGELQFDVQLERQGGPGSLLSNPRLQWWTAQFKTPPQHEAVSGGRYRITGEVLVYGPPFDLRTAPPITAVGTDGDRGGAVFGFTGITARGVDGDAGQWLQYVTPGLLAGGRDGDSGGWVTFDVPARVAGTDADRGGWATYNQPVPARGVDADLGAWAI